MESQVELALLIYLPFRSIVLCFMRNSLASIRRFQFVQTRKPLPLPAARAQAVQSPEVSRFLVARVTQPKVCFAGGK